ncbi:TomO hydrophobic C-terminal domain-containing protein [Wolbachia endosymbiont (group A) of Barypeithes pellucidus]|uniref:TomO hydrophobic C-terminal domain-containing protein n=1 Tax=Wolbachia endosymbiont (group A) of Barypeithes pellucidus TaxID=3139322 RepID=UPI003CCB55F6
MLGNTIIDGGGQQANFDLSRNSLAFISCSSQDDKSLGQVVQSIIGKVDSNKIAKISEFFSGRDGKEGWYDNIGIRFSLFDLCSENDDSGNSRNKPIVKVQDEGSAFSNELKEMFELISKKNRDVLYIRRRPVEQGQHENHWVVFYFFVDQNKKNILFVDAQNPAIGEKNSFRDCINDFLTQQDCNLYVSNTQFQKDDYSCGLIASEIARMLWNDHEGVKKVLSQYTPINREKVELASLMGNKFEQLTNLCSTKGSINYGKINKEFNAASIRTAHFATALYISLERLVDISIQDIKESIEKIRSCFINNLDNVASFNEQIKKISQGEREMPKTQKLKSPQETTTGSSDVKANLYPVQQKVSDDIHTTESSEHENNDSQKQNASSLRQLENTLQNQDLESESFLKEELRQEVFALKGTNLTLQAQLAKRGKRIQELEQEVENLNCQEAQLKEEIDSAIAQKLEQEESFEQAQQEINNLNDKLERELKLHHDTAYKALDQMSKYKAQLIKRGEELSDLRKSAQQMEQVIEALERELNEAEQKNLSQQRTISDQSRKHSNYASAAFVIAGVFAVGTSLTIPYLAICFTLAVAASISLIVGGCYLYKANTALSDVGIDQINDFNPPSVEV